MLVRLLLTFLIVIGVALVGCSFDGSFGPGYRCGAGDVCPAGTGCVDGFCVAAAHDAGPDPDPDAATSPDGAIMASRCGTLSLLRDPLDDTAPGPLFHPNADPGATLVEGGGHLAVQIAAGSGAPFSVYQSAYWYDLRDGALVATVSQVGGTYTTIEVRNTANQRLQLFVEDRATLVAKVLDVADPGPGASVGYDPQAHRHWRIREAGGTVFWETSPDQAAWSALYTAPVPFAIEHVRGIVGAGGQVPGQATEARFEAVGLTSSAAAGFCAIASIIDDFAAPPLAPAWNSWNDGDCTVAEAGGQVTLSYGGVGEAWCGIDSRHLFDLGGSGMYADVVVTAAAQFVTFLQAVLPGDGETRLEIDHEDGRLWFYQRVAGVNINAASLLYDPAAHRYWRIAEDAGTVRWQTSPDATGWVTRHQAPIAFDPSMVVIVAGAGHYGAGPGMPVAIGYRGLNLP